MSFETVDVVRSWLQHKVHAGMPSFGIRFRKHVSFLVLRNGAKKRLVWGGDENGHYRAKEFFEHLDAREQAKFEPLFDRMANLGLIRNEEQFRNEGTNLYALKRGQRRILCFFDGRDVVLIDGFTKKSDRGRKHRRDLQTATRLRDRYLQGEN